MNPAFPPVSRRRRAIRIRLSLAAAAAIAAPALMCASATAQPLPSVPSAPAPAQAAAAEHWKGSIDTPGGIKLEFMVTLTPGAAPTGTMSIPMQGLKDGELRDVILDGDTMTFTLGLPAMPKSAWARFEAKKNPDGRTAAGTLHQGGAKVPITMERSATAELARPPRPQTPTPPFPYAQRDVTYVNPADGASFAATLTIPEGHGAGPHPAVILITGSGAQDRDETLFDHKPFLVIADHLTRAGIAVLRADDRGVGGSTSPKHMQETTEDFVGDALAAVAFLKTQPDIDSQRIGLIGHSEGGLVAPMAAAKAPDEIAFIVMLAGTGVPGREVLREQLAAVLRASGVGDDSIARQQAAQARLFDLMQRDVSDDEARPVLRELIVEQLKAAAPAGAAGVEEPAEESIDAAVKQQMAAMRSPWMRTFLGLDPRVALRQVRCPVLALNGSLDVQVLPEQNLPEITKALAEAGNTDVTTRVFDGLNHLFQPATTGAPAEYMTIEQTMSPEVLDAITAWLLDRTDPARR